MPLPMVHFEVAVNFFEDHDIPSSFLLGSIAPDAIHMRKDANREDKKRTHLGMEDNVTIESIQEMYHRFISRNIDHDWKCFVRGYFTHILTDYYWLHNVFYKFKEAVTAESLTTEEIRRTYYRETDQIDFNFYKNKQWRIDIWNKLIIAKNHNFDPLLTADEINYWRLRTIHWFELISEEPKVTPRYITETIVEEFIIETTNKVKEILSKWDSSIFKKPVGDGVGNT